jgi:two-component system nitrogen regulation sensor histidine kinase NtrY
MTSDSRQIGSNAGLGQTASRRLWDRLVNWAGRVNFERKLALALLIGGVTSGIATFAGMTDNLPGVADPTTILLLLNADLIFLLGLGALIARRMVTVWIARRRGLAGARLHARLVGLFSLVAVAPAIVLAVFSVLFFNYGLQGWFSERVSTAVKESLEVAEAYLKEHRQTINADVLAMAKDLNREGALLLNNRERFQQTLAMQAALRSLTEAVVFDGSGRVIARAGFSLLLDFDPEIPPWAMRRAREGEVVTLTSETDDRVRALVKLDSMVDSFLYVGRLVDPTVLQHMDRTKGAVKLYEALEGKRSDLQITFALIFMVVALLLLLASVWVGLAFANHLTRPIGRLMTATERVRAGDLTARAPAPDSRDELDSLTRAFNRMTGQLESQQRDLIQANHELDDRRRFTEAVLSGVSAGVIGLDAGSCVDLANRTACEILGENAQELQGRPLSEVAPEMGELVENARRRPKRGSEGQIRFADADGSARTLLVRVTVEESGGRISGFVVTFDDITALLTAQRKAAWADVARRIAHEIKNPLTPIQLSAERLKRKYLRQITEDPETFKTCTDTIVRHVSDIGRMVDEFSSFARMPEPVMARENLTTLADNAVFLLETANPQIAFVRDYPEGPAMLSCDSRQLGRALTNLLQNAVEAIEGRLDPDAAPGEIRIHIAEESGAWVVELSDNGRGLPKEDRHRLTEPYVTTREGGTGLGLAIVKKIMEDHGGEFDLQDRPEGGARVRLTFPIPDEVGSAGDGEKPREGTAERAAIRKEAKVKAHGT